MDEEVAVHGGADNRRVARAGGRGANGRSLPQAWDQPGDVLPVEGQVRRSRGVGGAPTADFGGRERAAEEAAGGGDAGQRGAEGRGLKKVVGPAARRSVVSAVREAHGMSERRACILLGADRSTVRYRSIRPDDGNLRARLRSLARERR